MKNKSSSYKNLNQSRSKEKIPSTSATTQQIFTNDLVLKLISKYYFFKIKEIASRYETQYKNSVYSNSATTSSNTNSNINSQSNNHKMHHISGQNSSRNTNNNVMNDSKAPFSMLQDINTSPSINEHSYLRKSQCSNKQTFENIDKCKRSPWKNNFIKVEKYVIKNNKSKSQNPSKSISPTSTPRKGREKSQQPLYKIQNLDKYVNNNTSNVSNQHSKNPQQMNYNKIYQKLKSKNVNSESYGSFKVNNDKIISSDRKKTNIIDNVFNNIFSNSTNNFNNSPFKKDGYSNKAKNVKFENINHNIRPFEVANRYIKKTNSVRPKSANYKILN